MADVDFMQLALEQARLAAGQDEVPVGAVLVKGGKVVAQAHNMVESMADATAHAELLAMRQGMRALGGWRLDGCTLYVTLEPCAMCIGLMVNSHLGRVVFGAFDERQGCCGSVCDLSAGLGHGVECIGGMLEAECAGLLSEYFRSKRAD